MAPHWFASVMGTGIVATAAVALFAALIVATVRRPRSYLGDPALMHAYGAPPMAAMTVGAGTLIFGPALIGEPAALTIAGILWFAGTLGGLAAAVVIPYVRMTRHRHPSVVGTGGPAPAGREAIRPAAAGAPHGGWLLPVVPPMVSAATGAALIPHAPAGHLRLTLLVACYTMAALSLLATAAHLPAIWRHRAGAPAPTLWIVLGPLGQSITAVNLLGRQAGHVLPPPEAAALHTLGLAYGLPTAGLALLWAGLAVTHTVRRPPPFAPNWWSFTFPVGTCVTGVSALATGTGSAVLRMLAVLLYAGLVGAWATVAGRTLYCVDHAGSRFQHQALRHPVPHRGERGIRA